MECHNQEEEEIITINSWDKYDPVKKLNLFFSCTINRDISKQYLPLMND